MAYVGQSPDAHFSSSATKDTFSGDGSTTAFTLTEGASTNTVDVFVENVRQEPTEAYSVDGTTLTFTEAPGTGTNNIYVVNKSPVRLQAAHPAGLALEAHSATISTDLTVDTDTLHVDSTNNRVGVGTVSPAALIHGMSGDLFLTANSTAANSGQGVYFQSTTNGWATSAAHAAIFGKREDGSNGYLRFDTRSGGTTAERMRLNAGGQLLLNKTGNSLNGLVEAAADSTNSRANVAMITANNGAQVCYWAEADITSGTAYFGYFRYNNSNVGGIFGTSSSTSFTTSSDYRLKENVEAMTGAITRVKSLKPKRFSWIIDDLDDANVDGFLAHEAATVVPESVVGAHNEVDGNGDPVYQSIDQSKLVPLLTAALQEAIAKIETLETKVAALEAAN